jgi:hypothetical protein
MHIGKVCHSMISWKRFIDKKWNIRSECVSSKTTHTTIRIVVGDPHRDLLMIHSILHLSCGWGVRLQIHFLQWTSSFDLRDSWCFTFWHCLSTEYFLEQVVPKQRNLNKSTSSNWWCSRDFKEESNFLIIKSETLWCMKCSDLLLTCISKDKRSTSKIYLDLINLRIDLFISQDLCLGI